MSTAELNRAQGDSAYSRPEYDEPPSSSADFVMSHPRCQNEWAKLIDDLLAIRGMEDDWDGEGSIAASIPTVDTAISLAKLLMDKGNAPAQRVYLGVNGTIYFEWQNASGYREIEVISPGEIEFRLLPAGSREAIIGKIDPMLSWQ